MHSSRRVLPVWIAVLGLVFLGTFSFAGEEANLKLQLLPSQTHYYLWTIDSTNDSKGLELGKPFELREDKTIRMSVVVRGEASKKEGELCAAVRFENLNLVENRQVGEASRTKLHVDRTHILVSENDKVVIDSRNDIGLEKVDQYQRNLRNLETGEVRLMLEPSGRHSRVEGDKSLVETIQAGTTQSLFPVLAGQSCAPGHSWDDRFDLPTLGELTLKAPVSVRARMTFAKWESRDGRDLALIEVISAWESRDLEGEDEHGLAVTLTGLEGLGSGVCYFDPKTGCYQDGSMTFQLKYHIQGRKEGETTELDVKGKTRFSFKLNPVGLAGPEAPKK